MGLKPVGAADVLGFFERVAKLVPVITVEDRAGPAGMSIEPLVAPRNEPPSLIVPFPAGSPLRDAILGSGEFCVNYLSSATHESVCRGFAARRSDIWETVDWHAAQSGPILDDAAALLVCMVESEFESGLYEFIVGRATQIQADLG